MLRRVAEIGDIGRCFGLYFILFRFLEVRRANQLELMVGPREVGRLGAFKRINIPSQL